MEELQKLDQDPQYLNDFVDEIAVVQRLHTDLDTLIDDIKVMATDNLTHEQHINELRAALESKLNEFRQLGGSYEALSARYQRKSDEFAPQHIKELLQIAASNADSACDSFIQQFLSGSIDVQNFLDQYKDAKRVSALRKAKEERLAHQLNELERAQFWRVPSFKITFTEQTDAIFYSKTLNIFTESKKFPVELNLFIFVKSEERRAWTRPSLRK